MIRKIKQIIQKLKYGKEGYKELSEYDFYNKFYEELIDDPKKPWSGYHARRMIKEELKGACPNIDEEVKNKVILNFGSGCTGALRLMEEAKLRIEFDPLINQYVKSELVSIKETTNTILLTGYGEKIPISDGFVDVIVSRNSLDHVESLEKTSDEMSRILCDKGLLIIIVDLSDKKTICEPSPISGQSAIEDLFPNFDIEYQEVRDIPIYEKFLERDPVKRPTYYGRLRKK